MPTLAGPQPWSHDPIGDGHEHDVGLVQIAGGHVYDAIGGV